MSDYVLPALFAFLLFGLFIIYKYVPTRKCLECGADSKKVVEKSSELIEIHFYKCSECSFSWGHKIVRLKPNLKPLV